MKRLTLLAATLLALSACTVRPNAIPPIPTPSPARAVAPLPLQGAPAAALAATTVYPLRGEGWIALTARVCGTSRSWVAVAAGRSLIYGVAVTVDCSKTPSSPSSAPGTASWVKPVATMTCRPPGGSGAFGAKRPLVGPWRYAHQGLDLGSPAHVYGGNPVRAVAAGTVIAAGYSGAAGNKVKISHGNGVVTEYHHLSGIRRYSGHVAVGEVIGWVGASGNATGPNLHFQVDVNGVPVNPNTFMAARGVRIGC